MFAHARGLRACELLHVQRMWAGWRAHPEGTYLHMRRAGAVHSHLGLNRVHTEDAFEISTTKHIIFIYI